MASRSAFGSVPRGGSSSGFSSFQGARVGPQGVLFPDDVDIKFGTDADVTFRFNPAVTMKDATAGTLLTFGLNMGLHLRSSSGAANKTTELVSLRAVGEYDRPWVAWRDS